jgi:hypothetical protein
MRPETLRPDEQAMLASGRRVMIFGARQLVKHRTIG